MNLPEPPSAMLSKSEGAGASCRLCGGALAFAFTRRILAHHEGRYYCCGQCGSLQTQAPYWLDEAYADNSLSSLDTGAAFRNLQNLGASYAIARLFSARDLIDVGGGDGLLCRLLRDYELNCYVTDKYASVTYAQGFTEPDFTIPDMVLAFEIMEHYPAPARDLEALFGASPKLVLASTEAYRGQGADWIYLAPESGQHVFFYSMKAMQLIAQRYGYELVARGDMFLFARRGVLTRAKRLAAETLLRPNVSAILKALLLLGEAPGVARDSAKQHALLAARSRDFS